MTDHPGRELATATIRTLITPTMRDDFERWSAGRGLSLSAGVRELISDALRRDPETASKAMYRRIGGSAPLPAETPSERVWDPSCGMFHDRPLRPGERCPWAVRDSSPEFRPLPN